jgi:tRNA pseudouridine55 synthase
MNGIINVYKPVGMTSFDIVRRVKKIANIKKVGHTGTLDPLACGVLPVCIGKSTKAVDYLMNKTKVYRAEIKLGLITDTYDQEGKILEEKPINSNEEQIISTINSFVGNIEQIPPMYSALKVNGEKLYELARKGIEVERKPRNITIDSIKILNINIPLVEIEVKCSKGTYIRSLCFDIGNKLGCGAVMWNLERTASGNFTKENSININDLNKDNIEQNLISVENIFKNYKNIQLDSKFSKLALNGVSIKDYNFIKNIEDEVFYRVYNDENIFIGIGKKDVNGFKIRTFFI